MPWIIKMDSWQTFISRVMKLVLEALNTSRKLHIFTVHNFQDKLRGLKNSSSNSQSSSSWNLDYLGPPFSTLSLSTSGRSHVLLQAWIFWKLLCRRPFLPNHYFLAQTPLLLGYLPYLSLLSSLLCSHIVSTLPCPHTNGSHCPCSPQETEHSSNS